MQQLGNEPPPRTPINGDTSDSDRNWMGWLKWFMRLRDSIPKTQTFSETFTPTEVSANTTEEQTFTVSGLTTSDAAFVNKPTHQAGLGIVNVRVSATDTLAITFGNFTGAPITPTSETYLIISTRL
jgi:hypothetical protein